MPNYGKLISERKMETLHTHTFIDKINGQEYVTKYEHLSGTIYGDSITVHQSGGSRIFSHYWARRCPQCERGGHPLNSVCNSDCGHEKDAPNPNGLEKY